MYGKIYDLLDEIERSVQAARTGLRLLEAEEFQQRLPLGRLRPLLYERTGVDTFKMHTESGVFELQLRPLAGQVHYFLVELPDTWPTLPVALEELLDAQDAQWSTPGEFLRAIRAQPLRGVDRV